jgi:8-hydroxy-5-deazaflavin:NADPH oxidoreductase
MKIAVLGSGNVGRAISGALADLGHEVSVGTRDVDGLMARREPDAMGRPPFAEWHAGHASVGVRTFGDASRDAELLFNCTAGAASLEALQAAGADNLAGKILIDTANPLDFSRGMPPGLDPAITDSLAEQIQMTFPGTKVVKALNTVTAALMVNPGELGGGDHTLFVCGDDAEAKAEVTRLMREWFGWSDVFDLGDVTAARGLEAYLMLWIQLWHAAGTPMINVKFVR